MNKLKVSWLSAASFILLAIVGGIAQYFPDTITGKACAILVMVFGAIGHFTAPVIAGQSSGK